MGGLITDAMAIEAPAELVAMHTDFMFALPSPTRDTAQPMSLTNAPGERSF